VSEINTSTLTLLFGTDTTDRQKGEKTDPVEAAPAIPKMDPRETVANVQYSRYKIQIKALFRLGSEKTDNISQKDILPKYITTVKIKL
jgi:hypothetical protein